MARLLGSQREASKTHQPQSLNYLGTGVGRSSLVREGVVLLMRELKRVPTSSEPGLLTGTSVLLYLWNASAIRRAECHLWPALEERALFTDRSITARAVREAD